MKQLRWSLTCLLLITLACALPGRDTPTPTPHPPPQPTPTNQTSQTPGRTPKTNPTNQPPTPNPQPATPIDPSLPDWTILLYFADPAPRDLDPITANLANLDPGRVTIIAQTTQTQTQRHLLQPHTAQRLTPPTDPSLTSLLTWAETTYPANHTALFIHSRTTNWHNLPDWTAALNQANLSQPLDLIGLDIADTAYLDTFRALQPHAHFAIAPAGTTPYSGWNYPTLLKQLASQPSQLPPTFASQLSTFGLTALDLHQLALATSALDQLATTLTTTPHLTTAVATARQASQQPHAPNQAINLHQFASQLAPHLPVASRLQQALQQITLSDNPVLHYFPSHPDHYTATYEPLGTPAWQAFLATYYQTDFPRPDIQLLGLDGNPAGPLTPLYLAGELHSHGQPLSQAHFIAGQHTANGQRLTTYQPLTLPAGTTHLHQTRTLWDTTSPFLTDGLTGDYLLIWPHNGLQMVPGRIQNHPATLIFTNNALTEVWQWHANAPYTIQPFSGDTFQADNIYLTTDDTNQPSLQTEPGLTLTFDSANPLQLTQRPLPSGNYFVGLQAQSPTGAQTLIQQTITLDNTPPPAGQAVYLSPRDGFQFLYPAGWTPPTYTNNQLHSHHPATNSQLTITTHPGLGDPRQLLQDTLTIFGNVDILYDDTIKIAGVNGLSTAYGYSTTDGAHTGLLAVFVKHGAGYVIDIDGPTTAETDSLTTLATIQDSWLFRPVGDHLYSGQWQTTSLPNLTVSHPISYQHTTLDNGWQLFSQTGQFVALRTDPLSGQPLADVADRWLTLAADGVSNFSQTEPTPHYLAGAVWQRLDFAYTDPAGQPISGFVIATEQAGQEIVAWAEAPTTSPTESSHRTLIASSLANLTPLSNSLHAIDLAAWPTITEDTHTAHPAGTAYQITTTTPGFYTIPAGGDYTTGIFQVTTSHTAGTPNNGYGLLYQLTDQAAIVFEISSDGYVWLGHCTDNCHTKTSLVNTGWFPSPAIHQGPNTPNTLRLVAISNTLIFLVNGQEVGRVMGVSPGRGDIALFVENLTTSPTQITFSNLQHNN